METNEKTKGCVYFFRHIGLKPVKIGYSTHESPIIRFEQFKTYAPYGSEIIGFIQTFEAKELETTLHEKFSQYRLSGEWFDITEEDCNMVISFYSNIEDIKEKNEFQIAWAMHVDEREKHKEQLSEINIENISDDISRINVIKNMLIKKIDVKEIARLLKCSKKTIYKHRKKFIDKGVKL